LARKKPKAIEGIVLTAEEADWIFHERDAKELGRPKKYHPKFCRIAYEKMSQGYSKEATAGSLGITVSTLYDWIAKKKPFSEAIKLGEAACREHWEQIGYLGATGRIPIDPQTREPIKFKFNAYAWGLNMKNRFRWGERVMEKDVGDEAPGAQPMQVTFNIDLDHNPDPVE
jgi:hypothetical protein